MSDPQIKITPPEKGKGTLRAAFARAVKAYVFPITAKQLVSVVAFQSAIYWGAGLAMYPSIDAYLVERGVPAEDIKTLDLPLLSIVKPPAPVSSAVDKIHEAFAGVSAPMMGFFAHREMTKTEGRGEASQRLFGCLIRVVAAKEDTLESVLDYTTYIPRNKIRVVRDREALASLFTLLHEIGHCRSSDGGGPLMGLSHLFSDEVAQRLFSEAFIKERVVLRNKNELHADLIAIQELKKMFRAQDVENYVLYLRAVHLDQIISINDYSHDLVLSVDAAIHQTTMPSFDEIYASRRELFNAVIPRMMKTMSPDGETDCSAFDHAMSECAGYAIRDLLKDDKALSPWARRRGELYLEGIKYFAPDLLQEERPKISQKNIPAIRAG